jgi:hypothetical protein
MFAGSSQNFLNPITAIKCFEKLKRVTQYSKIACY